MNLPRTHIAIIGTLSIIALALLGIWIFLALESNSLRSEIIAIETETAAKTAESAHLGSVRTTLKVSKMDIDLIEKWFIQKDAIPKFIDLLESKAASAGIKADFGTIDITNTDTGAGKLRVQMTGKGVWIDIIHFIDILESLPYASKIENLTLSKPDQKSNNWSFGLELILYLKEAQ